MLSKKDLCKFYYAFSLLFDCIVYNIVIRDTHLPMVEGAEGPVNSRVPFFLPSQIFFGSTNPLFDQLYKMLL